MKKSFLLCVLAILASSIFVSTASAASGVTSELQAFTVKKTKANKERFVKAERVTPGGIIEYRITYSNGTDGPLNDFIVNGDVPLNTTFLEEGGNTSLPAELQVKVADLGWTSLPAFREVKSEDGTIQKIKISTSEIQGVRWNILEPVLPKSKVQITYRVKVDQ